MTLFSLVSRDLPSEASLLAPPLPPKLSPLARRPSVTILRNNKALLRYYDFCHWEPRVTSSTTFCETENAASHSVWHLLADEVLAGGTISAEQALAVLECPDEG